MTDEFIDETATGQSDVIEVESIWLPRPTIKPLVLAAAILLSLIGLFALRPLMIIGLVACALTIISWIGDTRAESNELPLS